MGADHQVLGQFRGQQVLATVHVMSAASFGDSICNVYGRLPRPADTATLTRSALVGNGEFSLLFPKFLRCDGRDRSTAQRT